MKRWKLDLDNSSMEAAAYEKEIREGECDFVWVAWGEEHIREALASAKLCKRWNAANGKARYFVYMLDRWHGIDRGVFDKVRKEGIEVVERDATPENPALYDLDRLRIMAEHDERPCMYVDTDLYVLEPIDVASIGEGVKTFGMGTGRLGFNCNTVHIVVEEFMEAPSTLYYADCGIGKEDYEVPLFTWPWIRMNMGMIWCGSPGEMARVSGLFEEYNMPMANTRYFGLGEMVWTAMHGNGDIPAGNFEWRNGWNKIWPFCDLFTEKLGIEDSGDGETAHLLFAPNPKHTVVHVGHFGVQVHLGWTEKERPFQMAMLDSGEIELIHNRGNLVISSKDFSFEKL